MTVLGVIYWTVFWLIVLPLVLVFAGAVVGTVVALKSSFVRPETEPQADGD